jgi:hypothetical protein
MLNSSTLRVEWDQDDKRQVEEAKSVYRKAKQEGRIVTDMKDNVIQFFHPRLEGIKVKETELSENQFSIRFFDETGDRRLIWDKTDPLQIKEAADKFKEYLDKGWRAFASDEKNRKRRRLYGFDAVREEIIFEEISDEQIMENFSDKLVKEEKPKLTQKEKLSNFVNDFKKISVVPKTVAG